MPGKFKSNGRVFLNNLRDRVRDAVENTSDSVIRDAVPLIPRPGHSSGYATGALATVGHYIMDGEDQSAYDQAVARAINASDGRLVRRNQITPAVVPATVKSQVTSIINYPLEYARAIHSGFHHIWFDPPRWIPGTHYLALSMTQNEPSLANNLQYALLMAIDDSHLRDRESEAQTRYERSVMRQSAAIMRVINEDRRDMLEGAYGDTLRRASVLKPFYNARGNQRIGRKRVFETGGERLERVEGLWQELKDDLSEYDRR